MIAIPLFSLSLQDNSWRLAILSGIFVSGTFIFYAEAAFAFQLIPLTLAVFGYCILRPKDIPSTIRVVAVFLCTVCICAHQSNYTAYVDFLGNLQTVLAPTTSHLNHSITQHFKDIFHTLRSETWSLYPPIVGLYSYYSQAHSNSSITGLVSAHPSWTLTIFFLLSFFGWMGYLKRIQLASFSLLLTVSVLSSLVLISLKNEDVLRFVRASSYTYLFALLGTILLALPSSRQLHGFLGAIPWKALSRISALFLFFLFIVNCLTIWNTTRFIIKHDLHNDPIIRRFNPTDSMWLALKEELTPSQDTPVLISGFNNSVYPHLIASGIRPIPHFLGSSIASFWKILNTGPAICGDKCDQRYTTHLSNEEAKAILASPDWSILIPDFLKRSRQALVPQGHLFPIEWRDVFALKRTRFPNFCDVVYKTEHAVDLSPGMMSDRHRDTSGLFRFLQKDGVIQPRDLRGNCFLLKILYDGSPQSLRLRSHHQKITQTTKQIGSQSELSAQITYDDALQITLIRNHVPLKLRWLDWQAIACNSK